MVYKKYIKRDGKLFGPYFYESYRTSDGKVKSKYLSNYSEPVSSSSSLNNPQKDAKKLVFVFNLITVALILIVLASLLALQQSYYSDNIITSDNGRLSSFGSYAACQ